MTALRLISLPMHGALQMLLGMLAMAAPFVAGFSTAGAMVAVVAGVLLVGLALAAVAEPGDGRAPRIGTLHDFDYGMATGLVGAAVVVALAADGPAAALLAALAVAQVALNLTTRYSRRG
jgi:hypothetical protein